MSVSLEQVLSLGRQSKWEDIRLLATSCDWPETRENFAVFFGMVLYYKRMDPTGSDYRDALDWVERARRCDPSDPDREMLQLTEAALRGQAGDSVEAIRILSSDPIASSERYRWHVHQNLAVNYRQIQDWPRALFHFDQAMADAEHSPQRRWQTLLDRAMTYLQAGRSDEAFATWAEGAPPEPYVGMYHLLGAELFTALNDHSEAVRHGVAALVHFRSARSSSTGMALEEYKTRAHLALANALYALGQIDQALFHCRSVASGEAARLLPSLAFEANRLATTIARRKEDSHAQGYEVRAARVDVH
ncbi:MAG: tetratricopeptide repeat protein [Bacillota bacterium]